MEIRTDRYPEAKASALFEEDDIIYSIVKQEFGHYCGYVRFPRRIVREPGYDGILAYTPVHGGITYAEADSLDGSMVYGFDCAHSNSHELPTNDPEWLLWQCRLMRWGICFLAPAESLYSYMTNKGRSSLLDRKLDAFQEFSGDDSAKAAAMQSFSAMVNLIFGRL